MFPHFESRALATLQDIAQQRENSFVEPSRLFTRNCEVLEDAATLVDPEAVVWKGDLELPLSQQLIKILGVPVGRKEFVVHELDSRATCHAELLEKIPFVKDLQCA